MISEMEIVPIWSSLGNQTVKVFVKTEKGVFSASSPTFLDRGKHDFKHLEVNQAIKKFHSVKKEFIGLDEGNYDIIDDKISRLGINNMGANTAAALSKACVKAGGEGNGYKILSPEAVRFPVPMASIVSGGVHGGYCSIQNFFVIPRVSTVYEAVTENHKFWEDVGRMMEKRGMILGRSGEGSWIVHFTDLKTIEFLVHHASQRNLGVGVDFGGSNLYNRGKYVYEKIGKKFDIGEQLEFVKHMVNTYNITYIQDPFQENDFEAYAELRKKLKNVKIVGGELYSSQPNRFKKGLDRKCTNGVAITIEGVGTVSRAMRLADSIRESGQITVLADNAEETGDGFLADLGVGAGFDVLKYGISGSEHVAKVNRLLEIWFDVSSRKKPEMARPGI